MRCLTIAAALCCASVAHAETDYYDVTCKPEVASGQVDSGELRFVMSIASGHASIGAATTAPIQVAMYENAFVWTVDGTDLMLDRFSGRLTKSVRGADGKGIAVAPAYQCAKSGGKVI